MPIQVASFYWHRCLFQLDCNQLPLTALQEEERSGCPCSCVFDDAPPISPTPPYSYAKKAACRLQWSVVNPE